MTSRTIPAAIVAALRHVRDHHPEVVSVTYSLGEGLGGQWVFSAADGTAPAFGPEVDVALLEEALDAAFEDAPFPVVYTAEGV